jgi:hypothetical protein
VQRCDREPVEARGRAAPVELQSCHLFSEECAKRLYLHRNARHKVCMITGGGCNREQNLVVGQFPVELVALIGS